jgi:hypothetical protein
MSVYAKLQRTDHYLDAVLDLLRLQTVEGSVERAVLVAFLEKHVEDEEALVRLLENAERAELDLTTKRTSIFDLEGRLQRPDGVPPVPVEDLGLPDPDHIQALAEFLREANEALEHYERTGESYSAEEVIAELRRMTDAAWRRLASTRPQPDTLLRIVGADEVLERLQRKLDEALRERQARMRAVLQLYSYLTIDELNARQADPAANRASGWVRSGAIFVVPMNGKELIPPYQFDEEWRPLPIVAEVLAAYGEPRRPEVLASWFEHPNGWIARQENGRMVPVAPKDALRDQGQDVVAAARKRRGTYVA